MSATHLEPAQSLASQLLHEQVFAIYRRWGYLQAKLDPLGQYLEEQLLPEDLPDLPGTEDQVKLEVEAARRVYSGTVGAEFMHIPDRRRRQWIADRMESEHVALSRADQRRVLDLLVRADLFEQVVQARYLGTKRFSLEGVTALIPFLDEVLNRAGELGATKAVMGHEPSRPLERDGEYLRQAARSYLLEV